MHHIQAIQLDCEVSSNIDLKIKPIALKLESIMVIKDKNLSRISNEFRD